MQREVKSPLILIFRFCKNEDGHSDETEGEPSPSMLDNVMKPSCCKK